MPRKGVRFASIDILRALTMLLMIFVNDLWTLRDIPPWLGHKLAYEDGLGLADVVFPAFLFIVGLSIPLAVKARKNQGQSKIHIFKHIVIRSLALLVMGVFMVNLENINPNLIPINKNYWQILMTLAFFLIWNHYENEKIIGIPKWVMQGLGIVILACLAIIYQGGTLEDPHWMRSHWWGILGIIGWGYLVCATLYLLVAGRLLWVVVCCLLFYLLNVLESAGLLGFELQLMVSASFYASVMTGVLATLIVLKLEDKPAHRLTMILLSIALVLVLFGFITRPEWGISKLRATPSWTAICAGITMGCFLLIYWMADRWGMVGWAQPVAPAGRSTLTCYLIPYFVYAVFALAEFELPHALATSYAGILKSLVFAYLIIAFTGLLEKIPIRLKI